MTTISRPRFKEQVLLNFQSTQVVLYLGDQGCSFGVAPQYHDDIRQLLQQLQVGALSIRQLQATCPGLADEIPALVAECDRRGLLTETPVALTGGQFYIQLCQFLAARQQQYPASPFTAQMQAGTISRSQLIGYVLESYHITHLCPAIVAPVLANLDRPATQNLLQDFLSAELHHDRLVEKSLKSVGVVRSQLEHMQPLPMTLSACAILSGFARQHPLSFKAALMLFEQDDAVFHELFAQQCQAHDLPANFYRPILLHAGINEEGSHQDITGLLLNEVPFVSEAEQDLVRRNMVALMDAFVLRTQEILQYYGNPRNRIPRCF